ncbi:MAG: hypothetical protein LH649_10675 [Pseudanabaena sp. CAN_BIN31]|nr:hypothetical protein [Pseudanabaena sp. CAN_BIN31]
MNTYLEWNNLIAAHFFNTDLGGNTVYLYVTEELINELVQKNGWIFLDFINAVKTGFRKKPQGVCKDALWSLKQRNSYPPYIAYLALFVLAAGTEGDFSANAYYPRLRGLLGEEPVTGQYPMFNEMWKLWEDLERWSKKDKLGEFGIFNYNCIGNRRHIGVPQSQTLLTEKERRQLPSIFAATGLEPTVPPSEEAIANLVARHGRDLLRNQTWRLLRESNSKDDLQQELRQALIERITEELYNWDGVFEEDSQGVNQICGSLRLCCSLDSIAGSASFTLRCTTKHEFPEDELLLQMNNQQSFLCEEYGKGWSSPLTKQNEQRLNASDFNWCEGLQMRSPDSKWCFRLPASPIRIFVGGSSEGLSGYIEVRQLPVQKPFYLAAHEDCLALLTQWGESSCKGFNKLPIANGLPDRWHFFQVEIACSDELKKIYPVLAFPTILRLELSGGIRFSGNNFFKFAPPKVVLQVSNDEIQVYCNEIRLDCNHISGVYELPLDTSDLRLEISARSGDTTMKRRFISLVEDIPWQAETITQRFDRFVNRQNDRNNPHGISGALVTGFDCPEFNFNTLLPIQGKQRVVFVGKKTGQISSSIPENWTPIWIISKGRRSQVFFCGGNLAEAEPISSVCKDRKKLQEWKKLLWIDRKTIHSPTQPELRSLWKKFETEAGRV